MRGCRTPAGPNARADTDSGPDPSFSQAQRGLLYTYRDGTIVHSCHLHITEWIDVIRNGGETSCGIERGFEEAITCHMATRVYPGGTPGAAGSDGEEDRLARGGDAPVARSTRNAV